MSGVETPVTNRRVGAIRGQRWGWLVGEIVRFIVTTVKGSGAYSWWLYSASVQVAWAGGSAARQLVLLHRSPGPTPVAERCRRAGRAF
jgi:hypothetical protein